MLYSILRVTSIQWRIGISPFSFYNVFNNKYLSCQKEGKPRIDTSQIRDPDKVEEFTHKLKEALPGPDERQQKMVAHQGNHP